MGFVYNHREADCRHRSRASELYRQRFWPKKVSATCAVAALAASDHGQSDGREALMAMKLSIAMDT